MEDKKSISGSNIFKIPIEEFEEDMKTKSALAMKDKILDLLWNYNQLSLEEFYEIEIRLHQVIKDGDVELIKVYLSESICIMTDDLSKMTFKIDRTTKTASLFKIHHDIHKLVIPRTIKYDCDDYLITSISGINKNIKILKFSDDSAVKTIYGYSLMKSNVELISFPKSLCELKKGWCLFTEKLEKNSITIIKQAILIRKRLIFIRKKRSKH